MLKTLFATTAVVSTLALGTAFAQQAADPLITPPATDAPAEIAPTAPSADTAQQPDSAMPAQPETETAQDPLPMAPADSMAPEGSMAADGPVLTPVASGDISADNLIGTNVQTMAGENIATVQDVVLSADGNAEGLVAAFGGFLGFGSNTVMLSMDDFEVLQDEAGNFVVETALTPEALEGRPEYEAAN